MSKLVYTYDALTERLRAFYEMDQIEDWWNLPHPQLDNLPAITVMCMEGGPERVSAVLYSLESDAYL